MKSTFTVSVTPNKNYEVETFTFPAGEMSVKIPDAFDIDSIPEDGTVIVTAKIKDTQGVFALALVADAIRRKTYGVVDLALVLLYVPFARQDRVCNDGEALSIKVFANVVNSLDFSVVAVADVHSDVTLSLLDNVVELPQHDILKEFESAMVDQRGRFSIKDYTLVAPDFGATKKTEDIAKQFGMNDIVQGVKHRDLKTGKLTAFDYYSNGSLEGKDLLIVDDICDGGGTFVGLAKELVLSGASSISLFVTHGIFSKGLGVLDEYIDAVYTTTTYTDPNELDHEGFNGILEVLDVDNNVLIDFTNLGEV
jgi:ribose-phosphate pyrophosphokinase